MKILEVGTPEYGNNIEFKSTFDEIEYDIAMKMYMKHNSKIASINDHLGEIYDYKDLEEAKALEEYDTLQEYKKALKEKCDAFDKAIKYIENHKLDFKQGTTTFGSERLSMEERKLLDILRGEDNEIL